MAIENITMPQLGESVTEGTIEKWLVQPGDIVKKYDSLAEIITDKVAAEIPSSFAGKITKIIGIEGETYPVGAILCEIEVEDEGTTTVSIDHSGTEQSINQHQQVESSVYTSKKQKKRFSPAVLKLANEHQINLDLVSGTGYEGRITRKDVLKYLEQGASRGLFNQQQEKNNNVDTTTSNSGDIEIPLTPVRRTIANHMVVSKQEIPHAWMMMEVDVTDLVQYRERIKEEFKRKEGFNLTYFAFFVKAVSQALKEYPMFNTVWAGDKIIQKKDINISIAVATDDALYVPVLKNVDDKSIKAIAKEIYEFSNLARNRALRPHHLEGGTFTVNNTGSFGSVQSMGIINYPQAAILQVESIVKRPVIMNGGMFAARDMVNLCLSIDHRILDGVICGKFLNRVKYLLENVNNQELSVY